MRTVILNPPFDPKQLGDIAARCLEENWHDASTTVRWLLRHDSVEEMTRSIRGAWQASSLPLKEWAYRIEAVEACTEERGRILGLRVHVIGRRPIWQNAPFDREELCQCLRALADPIPQVLTELALAAPGLHIDHVGPLGHPTFFLRPLYRVLKSTSADGTTRELCAERGCVYPDPAVFLTEIAENGQGCSYVLHRNGRLYYRDGPAGPGRMPCSLSVSGLGEAFFDSPQRILDPYEAGWTTYPMDY